MRPILLAVATLALIGGCSKKDNAANNEPKGTGSAEKPAEPAKPAPPADDFVAIPNIEGLVVKVPAGVKRNAIGGAAGFHTEDDRFQFVVRELSAEAAAETFDQAKETTIAKKWLASEQTADGWVMRYVVPWMVMKGDEMKEDGVRYAFDVRRTIGDKLYTCSGSITKEDGYPAVIEACNSIKAK
jgi:hypothetical protein